jgi:hypothetical protein
MTEGEQPWKAAAAGARRRLTRCWRLSPLLLAAFGVCLPPVTTPHRPPTHPSLPSPNKMNRTIQNYQKAYRKKVEGLKTELISTRADNLQLRSSVRRLRRRQFAHAPSLLIGGVVGVLVADRVKDLVQELRRRLKSRGKGAGGGGEGAAAAAGAAAGGDE